MKKLLFLIILGTFCGSFVAMASEYSPKEVKRCDGQKKEDFMDIYSCDSCPDICDENGGSINGTLKMKYIFNNVEIPYENGKKEGVQKEYLMKGTLAHETPYKAGKKEGIQKNYREDGSVSYEASYKSGNLDGNESHYYDNGKFETDVVYKDGKRNGYARSYYRDGTLFVETYYKDGKMDGIQTQYFYPKDKVLKKEVEYKDDEVVSTRYFDENGKEIDEKTFTSKRY